MKTGERVSSTVDYLKDNKGHLCEIEKNKNICEFFKCLKYLNNFQQACFKCTIQIGLA